MISKIKMRQPPTVMKSFKQYSIIDSYGNMTVSVKKKFKNVYIRKGEKCKVKYCMMCL